jgi:hypothetical protein
VLGADEVVAEADGLDPGERDGPRDHGRQADGRVLVAHLAGQLGRQLSARHAVRLS